MSEKVLKALWGSSDSPLHIGSLEIPCYVLEDETRVLSGRGMQAALSLGQTRGQKIEKLTNHPAIKPLIKEEILMGISKPIKFKAPGIGRLVYGYEATILVDICDVILEARKREDFPDKYLPVAEQCEILTRALARTGIIALVDEATGYQEVRDRLALQIILDKYITDEWAKWTKTFPDDFYKELFRLKSMPYPPLSMRGKKPSYVGHWTNDIIYSRLAPGVKKELQKKTPRLPSGSRPRKFFQHLTPEFGHPELRDLLSNVIFLMKGCNNWNDFKRRLNIAKPSYGDTIPMDLGDIEEKE